MSNIAYIKAKLPQEELLAQLAEEAAELGHAALKLRRALDGKNPTPVSIPDAEDNLLEEVADVLLCLRMLEVPVALEAHQVCIEDKLARWAHRLYLQEGVEEVSV